MEAFKFTLEKYKAGGVNRYECPKCHAKKSFSRYVDEAGNYVADDIGRCDREDKCGYHYTPSEYFRDKGISYTPTIHVEPKPLPPTDYIPEEMMVRSLNTKNSLLKFLQMHFGLSELASIIDKYRIGDAKGGRVIYWQIDEQDRIRTGKIMAYDARTGHRIKGVDGAIDWAHRHVKNPYNLSQCLYGLHLLRRESKPIAIVESEKTAIIASLAVPEFTWLATGGKSNYRLMEAVKGKDVTLYPDLGAFADWSKHAKEYGFKITRVLENVATPSDRENGLDIADYLLMNK